MGAVICGQGTFHVRLAVLGANDEIKYSTVMDIELPQDALFGSMHVKVGVKGGKWSLKRTTPPKLTWNLKMMGL